MKHSEFKKEVTGSRTALLFIHGILGTPNHFKMFLGHVPKSRSAYGILLKGHGKTVDDFSAATMAMWKAQVKEKIEELSEQYDNIIIAAHSMGTLLAINASLAYPHKVKALFLLAVPLKVFVKPTAIKNSIRVIFNKVPMNDPIASAAKNAYSIAPDKRLWKYIRWSRNYLALFSEIRRTRNRIKSLSIPCRVFQSKKDELVSTASIKYLKQNEMIDLSVLERSGHYYYEKNDKSFLLKEFKSFCQEAMLY